jgi:hypothetical protein
MSIQEKAKIESQSILINLNLAKLAYRTMKAKTKIRIWKNHPL